VTAEQSERWLVRVQALERLDRKVGGLIQCVEKHCHGTPEENVERFLDCMITVREAYDDVRRVSS